VARDRWQFPRTWHPEDIDVVERDAVANERIECAVEEPLRDRLVEAADHDRAPAALATR
jgi:hypothetical protein